LDDRGAVRRLRPYGTQITDYWDVVSVPSKRPAVLSAVVEAVRARSARWDELSVRRMLYPDTAKALGRVGIEREGETTVAPRLDGLGSMDEWLSRLPSKRRNDIRRAIRRVDEGEVVLHRIGPDDDIASAVARWHEIRLERFASVGRNLNVVQRDTGFLPFVTEVADRLVASGQIAIYELHTSGRIVGSYVILHDSATIYYWLGGHLPEFDRISPLTVLIAEIVRKASGSGRASSLDFGLGEEKYKEKKFGAIPIRSIGVRTINRRFRSLLAVGVEDAKSSRPVRAAKLMSSSAGRAQLYGVVKQR